MMPRFGEVKEGPWTDVVRDWNSISKGVKEEQFDECHSKEKHMTSIYSCVQTAEPHWSTPEDVSTAMCVVGPEAVEVIMNDWLELRIHIRGQTYFAHAALLKSFEHHTADEHCISVSVCHNGGCHRLTMQLCGIAAREDPFVCSLTRLWPDTSKRIDEEPW